MRCASALFPMALALSLAACSGSDLSVDLRGEGGEFEPIREGQPIQGGTLKLEFPPGEPVEYLLPRISGGIPPYESSIENCPDWVTLFPDQGILAGTAPVAEINRTFFCTYRVTESDPGFRAQQSVTYGLRLEVAGPVTGTLMLPDSVVPGNEVSLSVGTFRSSEFETAGGGIQPYTYSLTCAGGSLPPGMSFAPATRTFAGTPTVHFRDSCTYSVTDSSVPPATVSQAVEIEVAGPVTGTLMLPDSVVPGNVVRLRVGERARITFLGATGGVMPHTYELQCPNPPPTLPPGLLPINPHSLLPVGLGFGPLTRVLSGTPAAAYAGPDCTYSVTDSAMPPATLARSVALIIEPERAKWRFTARSLLQVDRPLMRDSDLGEQPVYELPEAMPEAGASTGTPIYRLNVSPPLNFDLATRQLEYEHPCGPEGNCDPLLGRTSTHLYQVLFGDTVDDTLCIDVSYRVLVDDDDDTEDPLIASIRIHDNAYWEGEEFRCPPVPLQPASASHGTPSNSVHTALAPVHARRALDVAHGTVRDRVRDWTPDAPRVLTVIAPQVGVGSLSGESEGFDYTGSSDSLSAGAEFGAGSWQAGLVGSFSRTDLRYRAATSLAERGYLAGEHDTEIVSLHPFAAWHMASGGHLWASLGAGRGQLKHRDELGFPLRSRSDVQLRAYAAGASVPVADLLSGELKVETSIESFAFEIEGGDRVSSSLPVFRGRDWRAGLLWSAPIAGAPSLSFAYKHLTGDGPEGGQLEARGSVSVEGLFDPRLTVTGNAEGSFGLGDYEHDSWVLGGGLRFAPGERDRGFALSLDTRLVSLDDGESSDVGVRGEAGYGLWSGPHIGTVRPYVGLIRYSSDGLLRRALGVDLRNTPASRVNVEFHDQPRDRFRALTFSVRHRF